MPGCLHPVGQLARGQRGHCSTARVLRSAAKSAETKLNAYVDAWTKTVLQNEAGLLQVVNSGKDPRDAVFRAVARTWLAALKKPEVRVSGDVVRLSVKKPLLEDDKAQVKALLLATSEDVQKAGVVIDALLEAKSPPVEAVAHFLGPDLAAWLLAPNATVDDCRAIAKHANDMSNAPDFPTDGFLPMTEMVESWGGAVPENEKDEIKVDEKACTQRRLPAETKTCLLAAKTIADMSKCPMPESPVTATFRTRVQGKWRAPGSSGSASGGTSIFAQQNDRPTGGGASLTVEGSKAVLSGYDDIKGELGFIYVRTVIAPELGGEATFARVKIGNQRADFTLVGDRLYVARPDSSGKKRPAVALERVTDGK